MSHRNTISTLAMLWVAAGAAVAQDPPELPPPDSSLPAENPVWVAHARTTGFALHAIDGDDFSDLAFLPDLIGDRRVVQLGESSHGVSEFSIAKVRLIKFLHERLGFDVVAFESSLFECYQADRGADSLTANRLMRSCISGVWYTDEILPLFQYILQTRRTDRPLRLAGFDIQTSTRTAARRPAYWRSILSGVDAAYADSVATMDSLFLAFRFRADELAARAAEWRDAYTQLRVYLTTNAPDLRRAGVGREDLGVSIRLAASTAQYVEYLTLMTSPGEASTRMRDKGMADNLIWLMDELYAGDKIITWGHNFHLRHANDAVAPNPVQTTGQWVAERHRDQLYTIGLYSRWGRGTMPNRQVYNHVAPSSGSLESILGHVGEPYFFIDLRRTARGEDGAWVRTPIVTKTWGQADVTMTLIDQYDAILFIDRVHPPAYR